MSTNVNSLYQFDDKGKLQFNVGFLFVIPCFERYMSSYDVNNDKFVTCTHRYSIRLFSRRTERWYQKFITTGWIPKGEYQ